MAWSVWRAPRRMRDGADTLVLLAIDVGNTQTVVGLFEGDRDGERGVLAHHWRLGTRPEATADELALSLLQLLALAGVGESSVAGIAVSSTVPPLSRALREMAERCFGAPLVVLGPGVRTGLEVRYENPKEVGPDRVANALGALERYRPPLVVVDFGTATTFDAIAREGAYLGGAIVPGVEVSLDALVRRAAALPRIELEAPRSVIGRSTSESMRSGVVFGYAELTDGLCRRMEAELGGGCTVVATGGLAPLVAPSCKEIDAVEPWLTLEGLRVAFERAQASVRG